MSELRRVFTLDIEVDWDKIEPFNLVVQKGSSPIQMVGCFDSYKNKYYSFFYHKRVKITSDVAIKSQKNLKLKKELQKHFKTKEFNIVEGKFKSPVSDNEYPCRYYNFNNERKMIDCFIKYVKSISPDIYNGFFIETFDLVYIINRCKVLKVNYTFLSALREAYISHGNANIRGSIIYDIPDTYAEFYGSHRHANSLKKVAQTHLNLSKTTDSILEEDWYDKDWKSFIEYCLVDVELCVLLERELGLINRCDKFEKFTGVNPIFVTYASHLIESLFNMIKPLYEEQVLNNEYKICFETVSERHVGDTAGGFVFKATRGIFFGKCLVLTFDLSRMYPNMIKSFNLSIETLIKKVAENERHKYIYCKENDVFYSKERVGFVPFALDIMFKIRDEIEEEWKQYEYGSKKYNEIKEVRQTIKDLVNAVTGQFDYSKSIILNPICANSIRLTCQAEIKKTAIWTELFFDNTGIDGEVIYGDTDSIFVVIYGTDDVEIGRTIASEITKWIQHGYDLFAKEQNIDKHYFKIGLEKIMDVFLSTGKKKRYFGHVLLEDDDYIKEESSLFVRGFEARRSDSSELTETAQKEIFKNICNVKDNGFKKTRSTIMNNIKKYKNKMTIENMLEIGIPKGLKKPFDKYKVTNPWLEGCKYANRHLNTNFGQGSKPKLLYIDKVISKDGKIPPTKVLSVEHGMIIPDDVFVIDVDKMIDKTIFDKLDDVLEVFGITKTELKEGYKQMNLIEFIKKLNKEELKKTKIDENLTKENIEKFVKFSQKLLNKIKSES